ncbi:MAG: hypothetical protein ACKJSG_00650 [Lentisphaeria bacterium]
MKRLPILLAIAGLPLTGLGQIAVTVSTDSNRYIQYEAIDVKVTLRNYSGETLSFNRDSEISGELKFRIQDKDKNLLEPLSQSFNPAVGLVLPPGTTRELSLPINQFYDLQDDKEYELVARIGHRRLRDQYESKPCRFRVNSGSRVWHQQVGSPSRSPEEAIAVRDVSINMFDGERGDLFYLQIEDKNLVYAVIRLGPRVQGIEPQAEVDALNQVHVLVQIAPELFRYRMIDLDGKVTQSKLYTIGRVMPKLIRDPDIGRVMVTGGKVALDGVDYNIRAVPLGETQQDELPETLFDN